MAVKKQLIVPLIAGVLAVIAFVPALYFYREYTNTKKTLETTKSEMAKTGNAFITDLRAVMLLPDEEPTIATVDDVEKVKMNAFFTNAETGDKVVIFKSMKKAILYRPSIKKIIDMAPVNVASAPSKTVSESVTPTPKSVVGSPYTFILYNGTTKVGLTKGYTTIVEEKIVGATVVDTDNAVKKDYQTSMLSDIKGTKGDDATAIAKILGLTVSPLPAGETASQSADFLIILGADQK
ncbi:MAG: hypothetical protein WAV51_00250 [Microgenomates group bacterium]